MSAPISPAPEALNLRGHLNGFAVEWQGVVVDVFPSFGGAVAGKVHAQWALAELDRVLARRAA